ncbi:acetylxylan esterase [Bacteroides ihuae]|uniref:acetylxylan esterase n=1 Tax=Bacteroides ihuae TaxID=1852362 RepID=UPI0008DA5AE3|nr:acetylxylan esterase [Bacteroides ihuae]
MNIFHRKTWLVLGLTLLTGLYAEAQQTDVVTHPAPNPMSGGFPSPRQPQAIQTPTYLADYFAPSTKDAVVPDDKGFIRRWMLLEPINKPNRTNAVFTDSYLRQAFDTLYFKEQFTILPKNGDKVKVGKQKLAWHALDSKLYNVKLYRFAAALKKPVYGIVFWAVTVIDSSEDLTDIRLSAGSNSASDWWLNGEEVLLLTGDRRMVVDDCLSRRITLKKGRNILRGAVINGPGMSDFCVRFLHEDGTPVKNITITQP